MVVLSSSTPFKEPPSPPVESDPNGFIIHGAEFFPNGGELDKFLPAGLDLTRLRNSVTPAPDFIIIPNDLNTRKIINGYFLSKNVLGDFE